MANSITKQSIRDTYNSAIDFALDKCDPIGTHEFLILWRECCWEKIRARFPEYQIPKYLENS